MGRGKGGEKNGGRGGKNVQRDTFVYSHYFSKSDSGNRKSSNENSYSLKLGLFLI